MPSGLLCLSGFALFLLGLLNGFAIPLGKSPRLGLSAHLTAVQSGTFLIAAGLAWPHLGLPTAWAQPLAAVLDASIYAIWVALFVAGLVGAGRGLPIAGGDTRTGPIRQTAVTLVLAAGSLGTLAAVAAVLLVGRWAS